MGTLVHVDVCQAPNNPEEIESALERVWVRMDEITDAMSVFKKTSVISKINSSQGEFVPVNKDFYSLIESSVQYSLLTDGAFDITVKPLIDLWNHRTGEGKIPADQEIKEAQESVGFFAIDFSQENAIRLKSPHAKIDLGAIAKGYAVDEAARILKERGIKNFFIDAGGDLYVSGMNCRNKPWKIGVRDPEHPGEIIDIIQLTDSAVTTSGDYEQFHLIDGEKYSHIIDPRTGYPQKGVISATVIAPSATEADALSTALCVLDPNRGIKLINRQGQGYAGLVVSLQEGESARSHESKNYQKYRLNIKD